MHIFLILYTGLYNLFLYNISSFVGIMLTSSIVNCNTTVKPATRTINVEEYPWYRTPGASQATKICLPTPPITHGSAADTVLVFVLTVVPAGWMANTIFACDSDCAIDLVGSVTSGSRRFNISLEINDAKILVIDTVSQLCFKWNDEDQHVDKAARQTLDRILEEGMNSRPTMRLSKLTGAN